MMKRELRRLIMISALAPALVLTGTSQSARAQSPETRQIETLDDEREAAAPVPLYSESHALVIAVSDYTGGWPDLPGVTRDLSVVRDGLQAQGFDVVTLSNPSRAAMLAGIDAFITERCLRRDIRVVIYFLGHGHTLPQAWDSSMGYIVPADAPLPEDDAGFRSAAVPLQQFEIYARQIQARHALFVFDSCFSGEVFSTMRGQSEFILDRARHPVRLFITSGSADEKVPDRSNFSSEFVNGLQGRADRNGDSYVSGTELCEYLKEQVINYSRDTQHPQSGTIRDPRLDRGDILFGVGGERQVPIPASPEPSDAGRTAPASALVIAVAPFYGAVARAAEDGLILKQLIERNLYDALRRGDEFQIVQPGPGVPVRSHQEARRIGHELGAAIVVWGDVIALRDALEIRPYVTILAEGKSSERMLAGVREPVGERAPGGGSGHRTSAEVSEQIVRMLTGSDPEGHRDPYGDDDGDPYAEPEFRRPEAGEIALPRFSLGEDAGPCGPATFEARDGENGSRSCVTCIEAREQLCAEIARLASRDRVWAQQLAAVIESGGGWLPMVPVDAEGAELVSQAQGKCDRDLLASDCLRSFKEQRFR